MKKLKFYILAILVPIIFVGCMEKGKSAADGVDSSTISPNSSMAILIKNNRDEIVPLVSLYPKDIYLSNIAANLLNIQYIFANGGISSDLSAEKTKMETNISNFLIYGSGMTWKNIAEIKEVFTACTTFQSSMTATDEEKAIARKIAGKFKEIILDVIERKENAQKENNSNSIEYYVELSYLYDFKAFLEEKVSSRFPEHSTHTETIGTFLETHSLITIGNRQDIYTSRASILSAEKEILVSGNKKTKLVITSTVLSSENKTKLLNIINSMLTNYQNNSLTISYTNFNQYDREVYNSLFSLGITSGFLTESDYKDNTPLFVTKVKATIDNLVTAKDSSSTTALERSKIDTIITQLRDPYDRLSYYDSSYESNNKSAIGSRSVAVAEILQVMNSEPNIFQKYGN